MTAGFVLTPSAMPGLRLLANYWRINTEHRVTFLHYTTLLANEARFGDRVLRAEPTQADIAAGMPGRLLQLDISRMNFGRLTTSGIDLEAKYEASTRWGDFAPRVSATWIDEFTVDRSAGHGGGRSRRHREHRRLHTALARRRQPRLEPQRSWAVDHGRLVARLHGCELERAHRPTPARAHARGCASKFRDGRADRAESAVGRPEAAAGREERVQ